MRLIPEWRATGRMWSVRLAALLPILTILQDSFAYLRSWITPDVFKVVVAVLGIAIIVARVVRQENVRSEWEARRPPADQIEGGKLP